MIYVLHVSFGTFCLQLKFFYSIPLNFLMTFFFAQPPIFSFIFPLKIFLPPKIFYPQKSFPALKIFLHPKNFYASPKIFLPPKFFSTTPSFLLRSLSNSHF